MLSSLSFGKNINNGCEFGETSSSALLFVKRIRGNDERPYKRLSDLRRSHGPCPQRRNLDRIPLPILSLRSRKADAS